MRERRPNENYNTQLRKRKDESEQMDPHGPADVKSA